MTRTLISGLAVVAGLLGAGTAHAGGNVYWSIGIGAPVATVTPADRYYAPVPVYMQPSPVYVRPAPVYLQPRQVYVEPPQPYYGYPRGWAQTRYAYGGDGYGRPGEVGRRWEHDRSHGGDGDERRSDTRNWHGEGRWDRGPR